MKMTIKEGTIPKYPETVPLALSHGELLKGPLRALASPISEFTFANLYLFRRDHDYALSMLDAGSIIITGVDRGVTFFMHPFGTPSPDEAAGLFKRFDEMKCASDSQARALASAGYVVEEDRDNFDYLYLRRELSTLAGRRFHRKKNLVNAFLAAFECEARELTQANAADAVQVLDKWRSANGLEADYTAAREALELTAPLGLTGLLYYVGAVPAAYALGEPGGPDSFILHFEKAVEGYKGLMQYVNMSFAAALPESCEFINMEQDLGDEGLRRAKTGYRPFGFVRKFIVRRPS